MNFMRSVPSLRRKIPSSKSKKARQQSTGARTSAMIGDLRKQQQDSEQSLHVAHLQRAELRRGKKIESLEKELLTCLQNYTYKFHQCPYTGFITYNTFITCTKTVALSGTHSEYETSFKA